MILYHLRSLVVIRFFSLDDSHHEAPYTKGMHGLARGQFENIVIGLKHP